MVKLFISSVQRELEAERREVAAYIRQDTVMGRFFEPFLFEELPAKDVSAQQAYLTEVAETVVCLEGCLDEVFYEELPTVDCGGPVHDGERALDETAFVEVARYRICPREGKYGIQIPRMAWHTVEVHEPSTIFEAKDGAYGK